MRIDHRTPVETRLKNAKKYLSDTDWYYARFVETGEDVPIDVVKKRLSSREYIRAHGD